MMMDEVQNKEISDMKVVKEIKLKREHNERIKKNKCDSLLQKHCQFFWICNLHSMNSNYRYSKLPIICVQIISA
jgi:hypothetical protein